FFPMYFLHVCSNIMSLGCLALAIRVLIDAALFIVENGYRHVADAQAALRIQDPNAQLSSKEHHRLLISSAQTVGPAIFYSLIIIVVSFIPVFLLQAQEGRMFRPLAWTKTLSVAFSSLLAITLVPALMPLFIRGRLRQESENPAARLSQRLYLPILRFALRHRTLTIVVNLLFVLVTVPLFW